MSLKEKIIERAHELGFEDIGFTTAEPFDSQKEILNSRKDEYSWLIKGGTQIFEGLDPKNILPDAKSIIVLIDLYFRESFPAGFEGDFGRAYLDDDRQTKGQLYQRIKSFRGFLLDNGIESKVPFNIPHRLSAARAGLGTFGKNNFLYSNNVARKSSWISPIPIVVNREFEADKPTVEVGCPEWCKNTCIASCPTGALRKPNTIDPRKCISYLTYFGEGLTPLECREQMGLYVYGCDRCQYVCPRNQAWLAKELPINKRVAAKASDFDLATLLHMDKKYYRTRIWPHMFYMSINDIWRWKMNVARAMGNSLDLKYVPELIKAFNENSDERVKGMIAWALGRIGGVEAKASLEQFANSSHDIVRKEVIDALKIM
jgi:epoxyqueuosine reductase